ncbi:hypothetical protein CYY_007118 [Polysphondylium violaceum]|uniref:Rho-GAP domain-containing protein n=1 Tax=Polysphondylium violaceum TaxID=133409 RepID=A0A8J4UR38_9MYCE|nr:hypothetical protein CYY_007118 [Polysphondylium violaceum]
MKNIFRRSVQIFNKKDKDEKGGVPGSPSTGKKDKKKDKNGVGDSSSNDSPTLSRVESVSSYNSDSISSATGPVFIYNPNAKKVFGVPLTQVPCRADSNVPIIVEKLVDHLEKTALTTEGVFRIPGRDVTINSFVKLFDNGEDVDVSPIEPYTAAGLLKRFFRDLPVFVPQQINKRVASLFVSEDGKKKPIDMEILGKLRYLVHQLPSVHFEVMQSLTGLLSKLMSKSDENKMTISNIAICLVPTLNCVPAIVTYPIQYYDFFFNEIFPEHHLYHMRPYQTNLISTAIEEKLEHLSTQPMLIPNHDMQKRYSRPASITISSLVPNVAPNNQSPSSSTITSTTFTSPHHDYPSTPITFTVTTTFTPSLEEQQQQQQQQQLQQQQQQQQQHYPTDTKSERRGYKFDPNDLQFMDTSSDNNSQYLSNKNYLSTNNTGTMNSISSLSSLDRSNYRRSVAYNGTYNSNEDTKAAIQQIKEKIDRYSKEKPATRTREDKEREKLLRYSVDFERFKERYIKEKSDRSSRDINKEIEREIEKRLSPRERLNLLLQSSGGGTSASSTITSRDSKNYQRYSMNQQLQQQLLQLQQQQLQHQLHQPNLSASLSNLNPPPTTTTTTSTTSANKRYSSNNYRYSGRQDYMDEEFYSNFNNSLDMNQQQQQQQPQQQSMRDTLSRQRSQSCFEPENLLLQQQLYQHQQQQLQQQQQQFHHPSYNPQYSAAVIEQKLDKIRDTINNMNMDKDNRLSRDYTYYLREVEDLRSSLAKESVNAEFFVNKNQELEDRLRREEEKNQRLMEEIQLLETYFILKEKAKLSKRISTTKDILTRSRSPTLPTSMNPMMGGTGSLNSSTSSMFLSPPMNSNFSTSPSSSKEAIVNQMLRGSTRSLVNLMPTTTTTTTTTNTMPQQTSNTTPTTTTN